MQLLRKVYYRFKVAIAYLQSPRYAIKRGYIHRKRIKTFNDNSLTDEYQNEVYIRARELYEGKQLKSLLDVGCGSAYKLIKFFPNEQKAGVELDIGFLNAKYPELQWFDYQNPSWKSFKAEMLICADVIEHVQDPDVFMQTLSEHTQIKYFVFSTPERDLENSPWTYGPPNNECHYREWSFGEFENFISNYFEIIEHIISNQEQRTQLVICRPLHLQE
ncbi:MAG: class I SAM-dependent methyltransferase [Bacteroidia bacterium]|jgi:hypothetical protein|nr:methyltransferase domain-containing protein [Bacteroidia bacterium]MCO5253296.1 class I SAM-dependent methyltransferase [Bacteroidota bacterium]MCZ2130981.1 class I SAM-dependent methyltransferase [Bacteroidia bacterium]